MSNDRIPPKIVETLALVPYFEGLDAATLTTIAQATIHRDYCAGQIVFLEGEPCVGLYIVQEGWLKAVKLAPTGREQVLRFLGPGDTFSEISVLAVTPNNPATVIALEPGSVLIVPREMMLQLLDNHAGLARLVIQNLASRVMYLVSLVEDLSLRSVEARLARLLLENASEGVLHRRRWATQSEMAARLGTVPDVLSRMLRSLAEEGIIRLERREIQILDAAKLEMKARDAKI
ncbi:MAG TPA: Crp/Fnr family transcriptional regulator [Anaerolineae bacterium]|nr:Crp/Fnr family transcriptional regulator [Anaerolineae bacterium]